MSKRFNSVQKSVMRQKALDFRLRGYTWREIGEELDLSPQTVQNWVKAALKDAELPLVDEVRKIELDRMQRYLKVLDERIEEGDDKAVALAIKVSERMCKMLGADMPQRIEVEKTEVSQMDLEIKKLIDAQNAVNDERKAEAAKKPEATEGLGIQIEE